MRPSTSPPRHPLLPDGFPDKRDGNGNRHCLTIRRHAPARELHRERGEGFVAESQSLLLRHQDGRLSTDAKKWCGARILFRNYYRLW